MDDIHPDSDDDSLTDAAEIAQLRAMIAEVQKKYPPVKGAVAGELLPALCVERHAPAAAVAPEAGDGLRLHRELGADKADARVPA